MEKPNDTVRRESLYVALFTLILCMLMNAVFLVIRRWSFPVLWGTLLGGGSSCLNFFAMGLSLQKAMQKSDDTAAVKGMMRASQSIRMVILFAVAALGAALDVFNTAAVLIPLFFPRIAIAFQPLLEKKTAAKQTQPTQKGEDEK